jgi:hypothetical protein
LSKKIPETSTSPGKSEQRLETDMKKISNEYVSDMLEKIETENKTSQELTAEEEVKLAASLTKQ